MGWAKAFQEQAQEKGEPGEKSAEVVTDGGEGGVAGGVGRSGGLENDVAISLANDFAWLAVTGLSCANDRKGSVGGRVAFHIARRELTGRALEARCYSPILALAIRVPGPTFGSKGGIFLTALVGCRAQ